MVQTRSIRCPAGNLARPGHAIRRLWLCRSERDGRQTELGVTSTTGERPVKDDLLVIAGRSFTSRLMVGTGKFPSAKALEEALVASEAEIVTVA